MSILNLTQTEGQCIHFGLSTDTKPVGEDDGYTFIETDTGKVFQLESSIWTEKLNVSYGTQGNLDLKAPLASPTFTGTVGGITKAMVGLGSVDNTTDANKPVSSAQQSALDTKQATLVSATNIKTINGSTVLGSGDLVVSGAAAWGDVTGTLANQTDLQTALDGKADDLGVDDNYVTDAQLVVIGNTSGTNTGDQTLPVKATGAEIDTGTNDTKFATPKAIEDSLYIKAAYADAKVADAINDGTTTIAPSQNAVFDALALKAPLASPTFTGTVTLPASQAVNGVTLSTAQGTSNFLRGDGSYATPAGGSGISLGLAVASIGGLNLS